VIVSTCRQNCPFSRWANWGLLEGKTCRY